MRLHLEPASRAHWSRPGKPSLDSFAAITDEPTPEVAATGHQRTIITIQEHYLAEWLSPKALGKERLEHILSDTELLHYVHQSLLEAFGEHGPHYLHMPVPRKEDRLKPHIQGKWKHFERLVAAIHKAADSGATVRWDEQINGRQFDVTIRFRRGLYEHLTVVECKNYKHAVPVEKVDALVTKARDVHANVSVLASTKGFQSGAKECAKRHGVTLLHVKQGTSVDLSVFGATWVSQLKCCISNASVLSTPMVASKNFRPKRTS